MTIGAYIDRLERGENITRPMQEVQLERERITAEYQALLTSDADRTAFADTLGLARTVFPYVENHNFYVEHWYHTVFWNKVREFGALFVSHGFFGEPDDIFLLRHDEVRSALEDLRLAWSSGAAAAYGPSHWPTIVARRAEIYEAMRRWSPPPALGPVPEEITDPLTVMLWGITPERLEEWLSSGTRIEPPDRDHGLTRTRRGRARVILDSTDAGTSSRGRSSSRRPPRRAGRPSSARSPAPSWTSAV
jgi:pyruvate,water dikinase